MHELQGGRSLISSQHSSISGEGVGTNRQHLPAMEDPPQPPEAQMSSASKRNLQLMPIDALWLYNRLQTLGGMLLVDTRSNDAFCTASIRYAFNISQPADMDMNLSDATIDTLEAQGVVSRSGRRVMSDLLLCLTLNC